MPAGQIYCFGLFLNSQIVGFTCLTNYVPKRDKIKRKMLHFNRTVIHPDYAGVGLGIKFTDEIAKVMYNRNFDLRRKLSSKALVKSLNRSQFWKLTHANYHTPPGDINSARTRRNKVQWFSYKFVPENNK